MHDGGFGLSEDDPRVLEQRRLLAETTTAASRLQANYERTRTVWQAAARTRSSVEAWLRSPVPGTIIEAYTGREPQLGRGETIIDAVSRLERRCRELRADLHRIKSAPYPLEHGKVRLREILVTLAQQGQPHVSQLIEHAEGQIAWPTATQTAQIYNAEGQRPVAFVEAVPVIPFLAWLLGDLIGKRLDAMLEEEADDGAALSVPDRQPIQFLAKVVEQAISAVPVPVLVAARARMEELYYRSQPEWCGSVRSVIAKRMEMEQGK